MSGRQTARASRKGRESGDNPILPFLRAQAVLVLDGGLATTLEARGFDLADELWSARLLLEAPDAIRRVHRDFLVAGADCIATASYQASLPGFRKRGLSERTAGELLRLSVRLAVSARDEFWNEKARRAGRLRPLVAASVGPYGAFLADGSEYTGDYGIGAAELDAFHRERWNILAGTEADLLACETLPSRTEAEVLLGLLRETPGTWAWLSFSCRDEVHLHDGSRLAEVAKACDGEARVAAVGINCTSPKLIGPLIAEARRGTDKPLFVYPNSGERYDAGRRTWTAGPGHVDWGKLVPMWVRAGARGVGGCCRVGPEEIGRIRRVVG
ncbi:MAG: homocysteine S-methyltransferase [Gemmatimonadota bacterium]